MFTSDVNGAIRGVGERTSRERGLLQRQALAVRHEPVRGGPFTAVTTLISNAVEKDHG